jgi:hypothetical protein
LFGGFFNILGMLGVPAKLKTPDLLSFTAAVHPELEMMRVIHDGNPNQVFDYY